ncbi:uncharacterized protein LOC143233561 isoform X3 [Tachypleus tridentatus]|uniref:uncharacterized protein LOC143233558 isoform X3 n=2 Tax=Tachypleus tridentatus TaxID=6853 RepID=UPI003FCF7C77
MMICLAELNYVLCNVGLPCSVRNSQRTGGIQARMTGVDHRTTTLSTTKGIDPLHGMRCGWLDKSSRSSAYIFSSFHPSDLWWVFDCNLILPLPLTLQPQGLLVSCLDSGI